MAALGGPLLVTPTGSDVVPSATIGMMGQGGAQRMTAFGGSCVITADAYDSLSRLPSK